LSCVGRGLCDGLITRSKESYHVSNKIQKPEKEATDLHGPQEIQTTMMIMIMMMMTMTMTMTMNKPLRRHRRELEDNIKRDFRGTM
jgi:hypothetical protein